MFKHSISVGIILCLFMGQPLFGQAQVKNSAIKEALIFRPDQDVIRGKLLEIRQDAIVVLSSERERAVPFSGISRIILTYDRRAGGGPVIGAILGGYAGVLVLAHAENRGGFVESPNSSEYLLIVAPSIALGAGLGYLVDQAPAQTEEAFDFTGGEESRVREKSRLIAAATQETRESKVHVSFQGSHIYSHMPKTGPDAYPTKKLSMFNILRKVQATYSLLPELEAGVAFVWFDEPPQSSYSSEYSTNNLNKSISRSQTFKGAGKYLVALYKPFPQFLDPRVGIKVGGGIGTAGIDFLQTTSIWTYAQGGTSQHRSSSFSVSENVFVTYLFGQLEFELFDGLSVGLVADKVFGPTRKAPAVPEVNVPAQELRLDNASLGFNIILHF
ncbi:MAG: hypothetical protein HY961_13800 [Ignavibacteriae bacterium]|nr:hypothetical protein [Ignavibacteriota bacterium]